ncbi:hypothetical protein CRM22_005493, partial [Opisthorchis felineus]
VVLSMLALPRIIALGRPLLVKRTMALTPNPYRHQGKQYKDPLSIIAFVCVMIPLSWMAYDRAKGIDQVPRRGSI